MADYGSGTFTDAELKRQRDVANAREIGFRVVSSTLALWECGECFATVRLEHVADHDMWHKRVEEKLDNPINIINYGLSTEKIR